LGPEEAIVHMHVFVCPRAHPHMQLHMTHVVTGATVNFATTVKVRAQLVLH
jgi:hypothetical protein